MLDIKICDTEETDFPLSRASNSFCHIHLGLQRLPTATYFVPVPIVALLLVLDGSAVAQGHPDLAIGHVQSQQRDDASARHVQDQTFGRVGLDVKREVRPGRSKTDVLAFFK